MLISGAVFQRSPGKTSWRKCNGSQSSDVRRSVSTKNRQGDWVHPAAFEGRASSLSDQSRRDTSMVESARSHVCTSRRPNHLQPSNSQTQPIRPSHQYTPLCRSTHTRPSPLAHAYAPDSPPCLRTEQEAINNADAAQRGRRRYTTRPRNPQSMDRRAPSARWPPRRPRHVWADAADSTRLRPCSLATAMSQCSR